MKLKPIVLASALLLGSGSASAYICSISSPGFSINYVASTTMAQQTSFTATCSRETGDALTLDYTVQVDNGSFANPGNLARKTVGATNYHISYNTYQNSSCNIVWGKGAGSRIADSITWVGTDMSPISKTTAYWGCIPSQPSGPLMPGGQYDDTLTLTLRVPGPNPATTAAVRIFAPASCTMTVPPDVSFTYTAFGPAVLANSAFSATCTTLMPYTMSLDSTAGNVIGLDYALGLNTLGVGSLATTGTGAAQNYTILGSMAAGQAGICVGGVCPGSQGHTVTISY